MERLNEIIVMLNLIRGGLSDYFISILKNNPNSNKYQIKRAIDMREEVYTDAHYWEMFRM